MRFLDDVSLRKMNWPALLFSMMLVLIGLAFVYSASYRSLGGGEGYISDSARKQVVWAGMGFFVFLVSLGISYKKLVDWGYVLYAIGLLLLVLTMFIGVEINGSKRWIDFGPLRLQTSEFVKIAVILALAKYLARWEKRARITGLLTPFLITFVPVILIAKQPDLGTSLVLLPVIGALVLVAGAKTKHLLVLALAGVLVAPCLWFVMKPYQKERVVTFLNQDTNDPDALLDELYHLTQSKAAIGSGGLFGKGWRQGTQNRLNFLPEQNTDFIFSVICEEWGFVGATLVLLLYFLFFWSCEWSAERTRHLPGRLLITGIITLFATQVIVNTGMTAGQFPTVGLPLPFMSYGGSSLLTSFVGLGLIINVSLHPTIVWGRQELDEDYNRR